MKNIKILYILSLLLFVFNINAQNSQIPQAFYFQAFAADENGQALSDQAVGIELKIIQNAPTGSVVYTETHNALTNPVGAIDLMVGMGTIGTGNFVDIDWAEGPYFMEVSMDKTGGTNYELMGISQFLAVPYAYRALNLRGGVGAQGAQGPSGNVGSACPIGPGFVGCGFCFNNGATGQQGPQGPAGPAGLPGLDTDGIKCWDLNGNNQGDSNEDTNGDGNFTVADCNLPGLTGDVGNEGYAGPPGEQGPPGDEGPEGLQGPHGIPGEPGDPGDPTFAKWETANGNAYKINGSVGIGNTNPSCKLDVSGNVCANGVILTSDGRFKKNIQPLEQTFAQLLSIRGVSYDFKRSEFPTKDFSNKNQIGLIAQEVEAVYPELVKTDGEGYKSVNYDQLIPVLVKALQEVVAENESLNENQENQIQSLNAKIELLSSLIGDQTETPAEEE